MTTVRELRDWLATLDAGDHVAIDEGGLTLVVVQSAGDPDLAPYIEIGGEPDDDEHADCDVCEECGFHNDHSLDCSVGRDAGDGDEE